MVFPSRKAGLCPRYYHCYGMPWRKGCFGLVRLARPDVRDRHLRPFFRGEAQSPNPNPMSRSTSIPLYARPGVRSFGTAGACSAPTRGMRRVPAKSGKQHPVSARRCVPLFPFAYHAYPCAPCFIDRDPARRVCGGRLFRGRQRPLHPALFSAIPQGNRLRSIERPLSVPRHLGLNTGCTIQVGKHGGRGRFLTLVGQANIGAPARYYYPDTRIGPALRQRVRA